MIRALPIAGRAAALAAAARTGPLALFDAACLGTLPDFAGAPAAFEAAGRRETGAGTGIAPARMFGDPARSPGMVETGIEGGAAPTAACTVLPGPDEAVRGAETRVAAALGAREPAVPAPDCIALGPTGSCTRLWSGTGGCRSVIATSADGELTPLVSVSIATDRACREVTP